MKKRLLIKTSILLCSIVLITQSCTNQTSERSENLKEDVSKEIASPSHKERTKPRLSNMENQPVIAPAPSTVSPAERQAKVTTFSQSRVDEVNSFKSLQITRKTDFPPPIRPPFNTESYNPHQESGFVSVINDPLSTFSIDVDTGSYSNIRRWINGGNIPPVGAVRIEEMINYFNYSYPEPVKEDISISAEVGPCPWEPKNSLVRVGIKAKSLPQENIPPSNLVFLIDVSGSMNHINKLGLLQKSMLLLIDSLNKEDRVSIVVYAGREAIVLEPTAGSDKKTIKKAIYSLRSGGSTNGSGGIIAAYNLAQKSFMPNGNNRVILASDGDFNVGITSRGELERLIEKERETGVYLTVLGFGGGNYHDDTMELLADKGNGNYSYIDSLLEAKKVLVKERTSTLYTLAKDVKLQIEFNPNHVGAYRLLGYENRALQDEEFNDDNKDAGEIGLGHTVTALYETTPANSKQTPTLDNLKYQKRLPINNNSQELLTIKLRYKPAKVNSSRLISKVVTKSRTGFQSSHDFHFASAVAGFGMVLTESKYCRNLSYSQIIDLAKQGKGTDPEGHRAEFIKLVEMAELLDTSSKQQLTTKNHNITKG